MAWIISVFSVMLLISSQAFGAACDASSTSTSTGASFSSNCTVTDATTGTVIQLNFYNGFSDATAISAIDGNNGTTVGAQRKLSFIKAAELIAAQIDTPQTLIIDADFTNLSCDASSATLGSAGATINLGNVTPAAGTINTFYPVGLINAIGNNDYDAGSDITAQFNSNIGNTGCLQASNGWYYGFGTPATNYIGFTTVLLHEITHGLGFASLTNASSGAKASGIDDIFSNFLYAAANSADWSVAGGLSDAQRAASAISSTGLLWNGSNVNTQAIGVLTAGFQDNDASSTFTSGDRVQMYAPNPVENGSSVSHFNTAASPNELMEPQYTEGQYTLGLAAYLLKDIGWIVNLASNTAPTITAVDQSTNEDTAKVVDASGWASDADSDTLSYSVASSCATNISCSINSDGTNLTMTPAANHNGGSHTITINVNDGNGGSASDTFNLNVVAVNDAPAISGLPDIGSLNQGATSSAIDLDSYTTDVDGDTAFTYTASACGAHLTCNISGSSLTITAGVGFAGTEAVTIQAEDAGGLTNTDSFNVTINAAGNTAPVLNTIGNQGAPVNANLVITLSGTDENSDTLTYSETSDAGNVASITGTTLTLSSASTGTYSVTVEVSDGNGGTDSETFNFTVYAEPSIDINSTTLADGDTLNISNNSTAIDLSNVNAAYSYALTFEGNNANSLLSANGSTLTIAMPTAGQFAGQYTLTFTDDNTGSSYAMTLVRSPRLVVSASKLLANQLVQTLTIEGGASNTLYTLSSSETQLGFSKNNNLVTSVNADGDANSFYAASVLLDVDNVIANTAVTITVDSTFETVTRSDITLVPSRTHSVTVQDTSGGALAGATLTLDTTDLIDYNLATTYTSDSAGNVDVILPADGADYTAQVSLSGYGNVDIILDDLTLTQTVTLEEITDPMVISGAITALGDLSFASELPEVTLTLADGSQVALTVTKVSNALATFNYTHNLATGSVDSLSVTHSQGVGLIFNINTTSNVAFDIFLESSTQIITNGTTNVGPSGGSLGYWLMVLFALTLIGRVTQRKRT